MTADKGWRAWTVIELAYACKHWRKGMGPEIAAALDRTPQSVRMAIRYRKRVGDYEYYKNLDI